MSPFVMHLWDAAATPSVRATNGDGVTVLSASFVVTLPTYEVGDVVFINLRLGTFGVAVTTPDGWVEMNIDDSVAWMGLYRRVMDGTEGSTVTFVPAAEARASWAAASVSGAAVTEAAFAESVSAQSEDPPSVTASWGANDNLAFTFLSSRASDWEATPPSGYAGTFVGSTDISGNTVRSRTYGAYRAITTATEDPSAWTITVGVTTSPRAITLLVRPA